MDIVTLKMQEYLFKGLIKNGHLDINDVDIRSIEPDDFDYSFSDKWMETKKESVKAFKKLKEIEFKLRN